MPQISHIKYSDVIEAGRFDADFFKPAYLLLRKKISSMKHDKLVSYLKLGKIITGHTPSMEEKKYYGGNINFIKTDNLRENHINHNFKHYLSEKGDGLLKKTQLKENDILITIIGASLDVVGRVAIVKKEDLPANINQNIALVRIDESLISSDVLNIYLNSKFGRSYLYSLSRQTGQVNLNCREVENILIPTFPSIFQQKITKLVQVAYSKKQQSKQLYQEAEELLLIELGLKDHTFSHALTFTTTKKEVDQMRRYDAEYFQPKYDEMIEKIEQYQGGWDFVENIFEYKKGFEPGTEAYVEEGKKFVRVSDFSKFGFEGTGKKISEKMFDELKDNYAPKKGEILFTKDGTIGISYLLKEDVEGILSGAFLRLQVKEAYQAYDKECITLMLNSIICSLQVERFSGGALIAHLKPSDFQKLKLPLIDPQIQQLISAKVQESFRLRNESKQLLEQAKKMVEDEIEKE